MSLRSIVSLSFCLVVAACQATAPAQSPSGGAAEPMRGSIATARPLGAGLSLPEMDVPCEATFYVGPFTFAADGDAARTVTTLRSPGGAQVCGLQASWVSGTDGGGAVDFQPANRAQVDGLREEGVSGSSGVESQREAGHVPWVC